MDTFGQGERIISLAISRKTTENADKNTKKL